MSALDPLPLGQGVQLLPGEPRVQRWRSETWAGLATRLVSHTRPPVPRPVIVGIDGRSGSGTSTVAERLAEQVTGAVVVDIDVVATPEVPWEWDGVLAAHLLLPVRAGGGVRMDLPRGGLEVPAGTPLLVLGGAGCTRVSLTSLVDWTIWVQADAGEIDRRRHEHHGSAAATWGQPDPDAEWSRLLRDRPWDRAHVLVSGTPDLVPGEEIRGRPAGVGSRPGREAPWEVLTAVREGSLAPSDTCRC